MKINVIAQITNIHRFYTVGVMAGILEIEC